MRYLFLMILFFQSSVAETNSVKSFHFGKQKFELFEREPGIWVSVDCKSSCKAFTAAKESSPNKLPKNWGQEGTNPGAALCKYVAHGTVFIAYDSNRNQQSLCKFSDHSYVSTGSFR